MAYSSKSGVPQDIHVNPMAQTFALGSIHGAYLTKVEVFFQEKSATYPITLAIRNADQGAPNTYQIIPGSQVTRNASSITTSTDASVATSFEFDEPVYLHPGKMHAFTLACSEANTYKVWGGKVLDFNLGSTTRKIVKNLAPGNMFSGNTGNAPAPNLDVDLKYNLYVAKFASTSGIAKFFDANVDEDPLIDDPFTGTASSAVIRVQHPNHGFQINDRVNIIGVTGTLNGITAANLNGRRVITAVDGTGYKFNAGGNATASVEFGGSGIFASKQIKYDVIQPSIEIYNPRNTSTVSLTGDIATSKSFAGTETPYGVTSNLAMVNDQDTKLDVPHVIMNDSNENLHSITQSTIISATMSTDISNNFISPFIDAQRASLTVIGNIIDNQDSAATVGFNVPLNFVPETHPTSGSSLAKHITKTVRLEEPSTGLRVLYGANVQSTTSVDLYYRTGAIGDDSDLSTTNFIAATVDADPGKSIDDNQYKDYEYNIGATTGTTLPEFNAFQVKLVMNSTDQNIVPKIRDLSIIALGT
tara:strand:- start:409 stop:1998 length:1590 start_codon:yes stop_codon:yes gene_type:complete